jgi:hypothetical protein
MLGVLFSAFFERGRDLRRIDELVALAGEVDLDPADTRAAPATGRYADAVRATVSWPPRTVSGRSRPTSWQGTPDPRRQTTAVLLDALRTAGETRGR